MKISLAVAGAVLLGSSLTACGGSDSGGGDYCAEIKAAASNFQGIESGDLGQLDDAFQTFHKLADSAPSEVKDEWKTLDNAVTTVEDALESAGLKMSDLGKIQSGEIPEGVDISKLAGLSTQFQELDGADFTEATDTIEKHAKSECNVDLNG